MDTTNVCMYMCYSDHNIIYVSCFSDNNNSNNNSNTIIVVIIANNRLVYRDGWGFDGIGWRPGDRKDRII